ncbi:MAG: response regulator [Candidatus Sericytochromatia bacterium]
MMGIKRICLIDDDSIAALLVSGLIKRLTLNQEPLQFWAYTQGQEALDGLNELPESEFPDLILLDLGMPVMDGHAFLKEYASHLANLHPQTQVVVLTSSLLKKDQTACQAYPFLKGFLIKPLLLTQLKELLALDRVA